MPRIKKSLVFPVDVHNLGSKDADKLDFSRETLWSRMTTSMRAKAVSIPVFLVDISLMDMIYPPKQRSCLDPEDVRRWIQRRQEQGREDRYKEDEKDPFQGLEISERAWVRYREKVAVGLYISDIYHIKPVLKKEGVMDQTIANMTGHAIFLCPERIVNRGKEEGVNTNLVLDKVYYHELGHAIMDAGNNPYNELWARIIEESLANWIALDRFTGVEAGLVQRMINHQPPEYKGCVWLEDLPIRYTEDLMQYRHKEFRDINYLIIPRILRNMIYEMLSDIRRHGQILTPKILIDTWRKTKRYKEDIDIYILKRFSADLLERGNS